jgi:aspartyl-tRNA(Asn)/glutamyl-tRNA(Gln) amidotransferase subunit A
VTDPAELTLVDLLPLLERRRLSARELLDACLARVERDEPRVRAFVALTPERAREAAERADADRAAGRPTGLLAGVPVALKDLYLTRGVPTTASSRVLEGHDPGVDAAVWQRLRDAGAGLLGKTTLHEFAYGTGSYPTRNPWDLSRTPGGSSGGSGAALAARMVPVATGSDTGGSLRIPAAACGVSSLRPAQGRVSTYGALPLSRSLDTTGPMARRMLDVSLLLRLLAGHDPRDPGSLDAPVPAYPDTVREDLTGVRIGTARRWFWDDTDPSVAATCRSALDRLVARGAELVPFDPPGETEQLMAFPGAYGGLMGPEALEHHAAWLAEREHLYGPAVLHRLGQAREITPELHARARQDRERWRQSWRALVAEHRLDAVAHPTLPEPPPVQPDEGRGTGASLRTTRAWSVSGFPALSVPAGLDDRGLPVGLELAGLPEQEAALVGLGIALDEDVQLWRRSPDQRAPDNPLDAGGTV